MSSLRSLEILFQPQLMVPVRFERLVLRLLVWAIWGDFEREELLVVREGVLVPGFLEL